MRALIQRVSRASVSIDQVCKSSVNEGFLILLGVSQDDTEADGDWLVGKISKLRIFEDSEGKMNLDIHQVGGEILLISQFTLYADTRRGNRPGFSRSAEPLLAERLYNYVTMKLAESAILVETGVFGADMQVSLVNDGPVTILLDSADRLASRRGQE